MKLKNESIIPEISTSCLTIHAFVSKLAKMTAAVVAQAIGSVDAGGIWSAGLCGCSNHTHSHTRVIGPLLL